MQFSVHSRRSFFLFLLFTFISYPQPARPQNAVYESGASYLRNFGYKEYGAHQQNWAVVEDHRGLVYVANNWAVLEYDGVSWRLIPTGKSSPVISLAVDSDNLIYVGMENGLGYLWPDPAGQMRFVSLEDSLPEQDRQLSDVWRIHALQDGVYFFTVRKIFRWAKRAFKSWPVNALSRSRAVNGMLHYGEQGVGLLRLTGDSLQLVPGGERFAETRFEILLPLGKEKKILVGTRSEGLFLQEGERFVPFPTEADSFLKNNLLYSGVSLSNGHLALGTIRGGAVIMDESGRVLRRFNSASGLRDDTIISLFQDRQEALWLAFLNGLARAEISTPLSRFSSERGLESGVERIVRHRGRIYAATHRGVYFLEATTPRELIGGSPMPGAAFKPVEGIENFAWSLFSFEKDLLAATDDGLFRIEGRRATLVKSAPGRAFSFYRPLKYSNTLYLGLTDGLAVLKKLNGRWVNAGRVQGINEEIRSIAGDRQGNLWLGTNVRGTLRVSGLNPAAAPQNGEFPAIVTPFGRQQGLPIGEINVFNVKGRVTFATEEGLHRFDGRQEKFRPDSTFGAIFADSLRYIGRVAEDSQGQVWIFSRKGKERMVGFAAPQPDGSYAWHNTPFRRMNDLGIVYAIYPEADGTVWFGGTEGVARYAAPGQGNFGESFRTLIRQVVVKDDSLIYGGAPTKPFQSFETFESVIIPYAANAMRFEYAAAFYDEPAANQFQYRLEGFDGNWSNWTSETHKDYTNLPEGDFVFRVRAKNIYGYMGEEDRFAFTILPPWHRTRLAYFIYVMIAAAAIAGFMHWQSRRLQRKAEERLQRELEKEQMRSRIASDLHDEIGSNLSSISMISQLLLKKNRLGEAEKKGLANIRRMAAETANSMRDIVWFVNPVNDSFEKLVVKMRATANLMLDHLDFSFSAPGQTLSSEPDINFRRNLFLIYKESLQNIVKHSQAKNVEISLNTVGGTLHLRVADDGMGFDPGSAAPGDGLRNFSARAAAMGGELRVNSRPGRGTELTLTAKIP